MTKRRAKMSASQAWFSKRRGGQEEMFKKKNSWRSAPPPTCNPKPGPNHKKTLRHPTRSPTHPRDTDDKSCNPALPTTTTSTPNIISTLLVPYSVGSLLQKQVQDSENKLMDLLGGPKVRIVEKGGDTLLDLLGRNDPWAASRRCPDPSCPTCASRMWLRETQKKARKSNTPLPKGLITATTNNCRHEGAKYVSQCLQCLQQGKVATYRGETSRSPHQRHENMRRTWLLDPPALQW